MAARTLLMALAMAALTLSTGCRSYCERNYPCPAPVGYGAYPAAGAPCPAPNYGAVPAAPAGRVINGCTCTCPQ
jgi:hypothetical protein